MKEERSRMQKILLVILAAMILLFGILNVVSLFRKGVVFDEHLLRIRETEEATVYAGKVHGEEVSVTVRSELQQVEYVVGDQIHDIYTVEYPLESIKTEFGTADGIRILKNEKLLFEGGYFPNQDILLWVDSNGEWDTGIQISYSNYGEPEKAPRELTRTNVMYFLEGPEAVHRGSVGLYLLMVLFNVLLMVDVAYPLVLFKLQHMLDVRDPEPTDFYLGMQRAGWVIYPFLLLAGYIYTLTLLP
jgi:hypothetical protein